ncbi:MAG: phosphate ABC transporter permease PstA [Gemmatimonadales bacterium]|jgi:phosphate transport system permease protein|nr:phosphate ABC transporter permease PstA [Gemmatimonadales bacterium]MDZ4391200.1 phosphate ABC transporter permease PstA [Gemmatimonadales bacterium]
MSQPGFRRFKSRAMVALCLVALLAAVVPLLLILGTLVVKGAGSISLDFFTRAPATLGDPGGGVLHGLVGTLVMVGIACLVCLPIGIGAGIYCAEFPGSRLTFATRFIADVMNGTPSIVVGVFAYAWLVARQGHFSALAGSAALGMLMIPMVMRTTEEMIKLVPNALREAALALGYPRWRTSLTVVVRSCLPGIVTGALLAVARIAGETAPLLFTALGNQFVTTDLNQPMAALPLVVYTYATGPYEEWHTLAWATALVLILVVLVLSIAARIATRSRFRTRA